MFVTSQERFPRTLCQVQARTAKARMSAYLEWHAALYIVSKVMISLAGDGLVGLVTNSNGGYPAQSGRGLVSSGVVW